MARNIEIKARVADLTAIRAKAASLAAGPPQAIEQTDTFFAVDRGRLKVRAFANGSGELIFYDRVNQAGPRESSYTRVDCPDARALTDVLGSVLPIRGTVVKRREVFLAGRTRIHLDRVEGLGCFVELEVVLAPAEGDAPVEPLEHGHLEARELLHSLGIPESALVAEAYIDLL